MSQNNYLNNMVLTSEVKLTLCMLKDIGNYDTVINKIKDLRFNESICNKMLEVMNDMYTKLGYTKIDRVSLVGYCDRVQFNDETKKQVLNTFDTVKGFFGSNSSTDLEFDGVFEEYSMISSTSKFYNWVVSSGGIDEVANKLLKLKNMSEVNSVIEGRLLEFFNTGTADASILDTELTEMLDDNFIQAIENKENVIETVPLLSQFRILNKVTKGFVRGSTGFGGHSGLGKAQPLTSKVLTESGFKNMGDIKLGDYVFGEDGKLHSVIGVFPQGSKPNYKVTFSDGYSTECCDEHLWEVEYRGHGKCSSKVYTLRELINKGITRDYRGVKTSKYRIPITKPIQFEESTHIIPPYLLGALIGDGHLNGSSLTFSNTEEDVISKVRQHIESIGYTLGNKQENNYSHIIQTPKGVYRNGIKTEINKLGLNVKSEAKFIPKEYLYDSAENRLELLRGLFDTDGSVKESRKAIYTISKQLSEDITWLCQSLGMLAFVSEDYRPDKYVGNDRCYRISIKCNDDMLPFSSKKHKDKYNPPKRRDGVHRYIRDVEYIGEVEMQCIKVSNPRALYITDNFIVTHNTSFMYSVYIMSMLENSKSKIAVYANEQTAKVFATGMVFAFISQVFNMKQEEFGNVGYVNLSRDKYTSGALEDGEIKKFISMIKLFRSRYKNRITHSYFEDMTPNALRRDIRKKVRSGHKFFFFDTFKDPDEDYAKLMKLASVYDQQTKKYPIHAYSSLQLSDESIGTKYLTNKCLASARGIKRVLETLLLARKLDVEELPSLIVHKLGHPEDTISINLKSKNYCAIFIDKNRNGSDNMVLLYEVHLDILKYKEIGVIANMPKDDFKKPFAKKK